MEQKTNQKPTKHTDTEENIMKLTPEEQETERIALTIIRGSDDPELVEEAKKLLHKLAQKKLEEETNKM